MGAATLVAVDPAAPDAAVIERAAALLRSGGLVAFPTETVYGIGVDLSNPKAVARLVEVKGRAPDKPITVHIADVEQLGGWGCRLDPLVTRLMQQFWPGPLTLVLATTRGPVGFRLPDHAVARALIRAARVTVGAPSANRSEQPPATTADAVAAEFGDALDLVLDGGAARIGQASTVVDVSDGVCRVLRVGVIPEFTIRMVAEQGGGAA